MRRTAIALALLIVPVLALSGCTPTPPPAVTAPKPSSTPLFATEDEALKAATEAYAAYLKVSDQIASDGGLHPERIEPYVTPSQMKNETRGFALYSQQGRRAQGATSFSGARIQQFDSQSVDIYACVDFSGTQLLDSSGVDITPTDRSDRQGFELEFKVHRGSGRNDLLLNGSELWSGDGVC